MLLLPSVLGLILSAQAVLADPVDAADYTPIVSSTSPSCIVQLANSDTSHMRKDADKRFGGIRWYL